MTATLYKITGPAGECLNGGGGDWPMPAGPGKPGEWRELAGELEACRNGLHLTDAAHLLGWLPSGGAYVISRAEIDGELVDAGEKYVARRVRLHVLAGGDPVAKATRARTRRDRAVQRALARLDRDRRHLSRQSGPLADYVRTIGATTLPAGHPGRELQLAALAAQSEYNAAERAAETRYRKDLTS